MPGVPSSRACDGCRKTRKRCDQTYPVCIRCQRLQIPCIGVNVQRFTFCTYKLRKSNKSTRETSSVATSRPLVISRNPNNALSFLSSLLIDKLKAKDERDYVHLAHGSFINEIPKRLEHSEALTAATEAFIAAMPRPDFPLSLQRERTKRYIAALQATRLALSHPTEVHSLNTVCAIYFLWVSQNWAGLPDDMGVHPKGLAELLRQPIKIDPSDDFDRGVVFVSCSVVISERLTDARIHYDGTSPCWDFYDAAIAQTSNISIDASFEGRATLTTHLSPLFAGLSDFLLSNRSLNELQKLYRTASVVVVDLDADIRQTGEADSLISLAVQDWCPVGTRRSVKNGQSIRSYQFALTVALLMNNVLSLHYPTAPDLIEFRRKHSSDRIPISTQPGEMKPVGSGLVGVCLSAVWSTKVEGQGVGNSTCGVEDPKSLSQRSTAFYRKLEEALQA